MIDRRYQGALLSDGTARVQVTERNGATFLLPPRLDLFNHSPTGFNWGYSGSGPAQLALAILADHFGHNPVALARFREWACWRGLTDREWWGMQDITADDAAVALHQKFKSRAISALPELEPWEMTSTDVEAILLIVLHPNLTDGRDVQ
jgi:hypothetical protein